MLSASAHDVSRVCSWGGQALLPATERAGVGMTGRYALAVTGIRQGRLKRSPIESDAWTQPLTCLRTPSRRGE
jgi:hypothetical protein